MEPVTAAPRRRRGFRTVFLLALATLAFGAFSSPAWALIDQQGANDEPNQKDLTQFTNTPGAPVGTLNVSFSWDEIAWSGSNTGDGCTLFDTDGDGNVNFSVCVTVVADPAVQQTDSPRIYTCGDDKADRCTSPVDLVAGPYATTCSVGQANTDPFPAGDANPADTTASCNIVLTDVGGGTAVLIDACSYPSQQPNSDPSDCIVADTGTTPVTFRSFTASRSGHAVTLRWKTGAEIDTLGFNLYVEKNGKRVKVNRSLIAGKGIQGGSYAFKTRAAKKPTRYWIEVVDLSGARSFRSAIAR